MKVWGQSIMGLAVSILFMTTCKQPYFPPIKKGNLGYLVVDGILVNGNDSTMIMLSRTQNVTDSNGVFNAETGAQVSVIGQHGETFPFVEASPGRYVVPQLSLNYSETYQLQIKTKDGNSFLSDSIPVKQTPSIDSVSWINDNTSLHVYVTTHDPSGNTRYYRWQYIETWQYNANLYSKLLYQNGTLVTRTPGQNVYYCWASDSSTDILVNSSASLSQDEIFQFPLLADSFWLYTYPVNHVLEVPALSQKFVTEYSVLVKQYAITEDAYNFWANLKLNTEELGTIFSPEPSSQLPGNIHCLNNPNLPVIGYITASTLQQQRIFINHFDLFLATAPSPQIGCVTGFVQPDSINYYFQYSSIYIPLDSLFNMAGVFIGVSSSQPYCADCTLNGGGNVKPAYWPN